MTDACRELRLLFTRTCTHPEKLHMIKPKTHRTKLEPSNVNVRIKLSALWTSMLFVFAYVDRLSL